MMQAAYDEKYFTTANYEDYLARAERYYRTARHLNMLLAMLGRNAGRYVDYGCAVGHLVKGFQLCDVNNIEGYDISHWAVEQGVRNGLPLTTNYRKVVQPICNVLTALDVFEHMEIDSVKKVLRAFHPETLIVRIPICANEGEDYVLKCSRDDPTHLIRWTKQQWSDMFEQQGYRMVSLALPTIYCSEGVYSAIGFRDEGFYNHFRRQRSLTS